MELDAVAALRTFRALSVEGWYHRIMIYFLVSCFCDWICKAGEEQHQRGQSVELRQCHTNSDSGLLQCGVPEKRGHKTSAQGLSICLETHKGTKNSPGLGYSVSTRAACHYGYDFRFKHWACNGGANLNAADTRAERTGLNLHMILVILFSTNKLTPEKT
ncbi:hypothetical protein ABVT39_020046 [Epinephelus coioides]